MPITWGEELPDDDPIFSDKPHFVFKNEPKTSTADTPAAEQQPADE